MNNLFKKMIIDLCLYLRRTLLLFPLLKNWYFQAESFKTGGEGHIWNKSGKIVVLFLVRNLVSSTRINIVLFLLSIMQTDWNFVWKYTEATRILSAIYFLSSNLKYFFSFFFFISSCGKIDQLPGGKSVIYASPLDRLILICSHKIGTLPSTEITTVIIKHIAILICLLYCF